MPENRPSPDDGTRAAFDRIVEGLELELDFLDEDETETQPRRNPVEAHGHADEDDHDDGRGGVAELDFDDMSDEPFYRQVPNTPLLPRDRRNAWAVTGLVGAPAILVLCTLAGIWLPRPIVYAVGLTFVAAALWLIWQLPSHGPSRRDWPDDGAVL